MTPAINQDQQGAAQRRSRGHSVGAAVNAAPAIVDHQNQSRAVTARHVSQTCVPLLALHLAGLRAPSFSIRTAGGRCIGIQRRRADRLLPGQPATLIRRCAWRAANTQFSRRLVQSCAHQFRMGHEPGSDVAYPLHVERLSCGVVAMSQHCTSGVANGRKAVVGERNV